MKWINHFKRLTRRAPAIAGALLLCARHTQLFSDITPLQRGLFGIRERSQKGIRCFAAVNPAGLHEDN